MSIEKIYTAEEVTEKARLLFKEERAKKRIDGWFLSREIAMNCSDEIKKLPMELRAANELKAILEQLPLYISENAVFAGTQSDAFARTYALINPAFKVETFSGYCDPTAVYDDIEPNDEFTPERIARVREYTKQSDYVKNLTAVYDKYENYTAEVAFFIEQVTGHVIPDFRPALKFGVDYIIKELEEKITKEKDEKKKINFEAMKITLESVETLAERYADIAKSQAQTAEGERAEHLRYLEKVLRKVPKYGAENMFEAMQSYMLLWQTMCIEQAPNPFAFSVGNADRIFEPYRAMENLSREDAAALFKHFLVFYNVGDRSWAISQNLLISGKDLDGNDLTNLTSYALLDAYYDMNLPQPILSVKLHKNTPKELYREMGKFFFTPGCLTPSMFNDDSVFVTLKGSGVEDCDLPDYSVAGCQEPLIMGKDCGNTTNSWFNLAKILELTLTGGKSTITGKEIGEQSNLDSKTILKNIRTLFYENADKICDEMVAAANGASKALSYLPIPFLSVFMGGRESGYDMRDTENQGSKYNGSGCLIHGLSIVADSFVAIDELLEKRPEDCDRLIEAIKTNFENDEELRDFLLSCPKYGNNLTIPDNEAVQIAEKISNMVRSKKNYLGNGFRADWSSPSTHLLYGYWVGATPDGRKSREMLGYGVDPFYGDANSGLGFRILSTMKLPFELFNGGYASHFGVDPKYFTSKTYEEKGMDFANRILKPLFFNELNDKVSPFYLYVNVTTPETLRLVLSNPKKYAPSGVYIMRIHGTFVNFLDLSPAIQQDIIKRLDLQSTSLA